MHKQEECSIFGLFPVRIKFVKFVASTAVFSIVCIAAIMTLTLLNPSEEEADEGGSEMDKDYAVAANAVMSVLILACLVSLYALWKKIPDLLLPYLFYKIALVIWLSVFLSVLVMDDSKALDFGPDIYPLRLLVEKVRNVREDTELFPVILFILCLQFIVLETHTAIIVYRCRKSMLRTSSLKISSVGKKADEEKKGDTNEAV